MGSTATSTDVGVSSNTAHYPRYKVLCHDDATTTMEFVVRMLTTVFGLNVGRATEVMLEVHHQGVALVGAYTREQAEFRIEQAHALARACGFPIKLTMEPE